MLRGASALLLLALGASTWTVEVRLAGPLSSMVDVLGEFPAQEARLVVRIEVPSDAPADLLVGAYAAEDGGGWRQSVRFLPLQPGRNRVALDIPGHPGGDPALRAVAGLIFCTTTGSALRVRVDEVGVAAVESPASLRIVDIGWDGLRVETGQAWGLRLRPESGDGFRPELQVTAADGVVTRIPGMPPSEGSGPWSLRFTPSQPGRYRIETHVRWGDEDRVVRELELEAVGDLPAEVAQAGMPGRTVRLLAPLRTCLGEPIVDGSVACRISAQLRLAEDGPDDLMVGAYVRDHAGRWRQSAEMLPLHPGDNRLELLVPAGPSGFAPGPGEAGLVCWSGKISEAQVQIADLRCISQSLTPTGSPYLDRLRLDGVTVAAAGLSVAVGSVWSASVQAPATAGPGCRFAARLTDSEGRSRLVAGMADDTGRHCVEFHPSIPGIYEVRLLASWPDGRQVESLLPRLTVTGEHPCRGGGALVLSGPFATVLQVPLGQLTAPNRIEAVVLVPDGAPDDLTVGVVAVDHQHGWFQPAVAQHLRPGINRVAFTVDQRSALVSEPAGGDWTASSLATTERVSLAFSTAATQPLRLIVGGITGKPVAVAGSSKHHLLAVETSSPTAATGERWILSLRPDPFPANPFDPDDFRLDLVVTTPDGRQQLLPGFYAEDMVPTDRGDRERLRPAGGSFQIRFRPSLPGTHRLALQASWRDERRVLRCELPALEVRGAPWDGYVHVDPKDQRFFTAGGAFFWPVGPNLRSVWDLRSRERMRTRLTPDRGSLAYVAYLRRFAAAGANACEIWMSAWNLALEWRQDWPGFSGVGRYNQENAWRLDRILDAAWAEGMRVNLVINNHGQASEKTDQEWSNNPYSRAAGGNLITADQFFTDPWALRGQDKLRRYIVGRYADHPAVMGWKLWTEMDLTSGRANLQPWHDQAVRRWHELDMYGHPVASHWCGDYTHPSEGIVRLLDYVCIDAYHDDKPNNPYRLVHRLLRDSTQAPDRGLARMSRPVLVTEYGGNWSGTRNDELMAVDHASGAWTAFVSGHAGAPMLWWFEWVDQGNRFTPYQAIRRFTAGEDLRGDGRAVSVRVGRPDALWAAAWRTRTRLFGYAIDERWAGDGSTAGQVYAELSIDDGWTGDGATCEWWDPDLGTIIASQRISAPGGTLRLTPPAFRRHIAWKIRP